MKKYMALLLLCFVLGAAFAADDVTGLWMSIDDETGDPTSVSMIYLYQGEIYGRVLITYDENNPGEMLDNYMNPGERAELLVGNPPYAGLDIIWGLEDRGRRWGRGNILDPRKGKIYTSELWIEDGKLVVRGKIGPIGRNQTWLPVDPAMLPADFVIPDPMEFVPSIPQLQ